MSVSEAVIGKREQSDGMQFSILSALSASHFVNDMMQSLLLSIYPLLESQWQVHKVRNKLGTNAKIATQFSSRRPRSSVAPNGRKGPDGSYGAAVLIL
jgi:hypothetical protein